MLARNNLLGGGLSPVDELPVEQREPPQHRAPAWRYHTAFPEGKLCKTDKEVDRADQEGWKDHPGKIMLLPGHEQLFNQETSQNELSYEEAKNVPGIRLCTLCGKQYSNLADLNKHGIEVHNGLEIV